MLAEICDSVDPPQGYDMAVVKLRDGRSIRRISCAFCRKVEKVGAVGVKNTRYAIGSMLLADLVGILTAIGVTYLFFG